ncbi:Biopolymer transport protein ExbD [Acaryochloris thomasi RCC1774]|uniref:Biopolymer transport protein ExbD n=1 Tax=Acaryochloris thomasi RCC1774 TaxID=1764569 RepID=A0A2W1JGC9_9CYAN|nr:biopolymer transporter ExbD [Acaryochloris thomasi]PZD72629.1 Biopolymer transport protein ExbD [Acaryochloris thomasi RCC1774]
MRLPDEPDLPAQINIVPMIDVIFAILTFFIVATLFLNKSEGLPVNLPQASTAKPQISTKVTVSIEPDGEIALNRKPLELDALEGQIRDMVTDEQKVTVIINADQQVGHGQVVAVMDRIRKIDGAKLAIATRRP